MALRCAVLVGLAVNFDRALVGQHHEAVPVTAAHDLKFPLESKNEKTGVTREMIEAGERTLSGRYLDLCDGYEYPEIARAVYEARERWLCLSEQRLALR